MIPMKYFFVFLFSMVAMTRGWGQDLPNRPNPPRLVNDFAHMLSPETVQSLESRLDAFDDSTSTQIAVVTLANIDDDPGDFAVKLGRKWEIGNKGFNNGVVFLIGQNHKVFIATGYGLEGAIPDVTCQQILDNQVRPYFKAGDFNTGVDSGVNALMQAAKGEYTAPAGYNQHGSGGGGGFAVFFLIIAVVLMIIFIRSRGGGGPGGGFISRRGYLGGPLLWGAAGGLLGGGGGGGFGGGGGGGGGFGGFGGGSFGGGGAGGSW
jgi:uncharacterized protein